MQCGDRSISQVAKDFDLTEIVGETVGRQADIDAGERPGLTHRGAQGTDRAAPGEPPAQEDVDILRGQRLSSRMRPGEGGPLHRGGGSCRSQRQALLRAVRGLPVRLLRAQAGRAFGQSTSRSPSSPRRSRAIHTESKGSYGSPRMHEELLNRGIYCGRRRVRRLMRRAGLEGRCKKRWRKTTVPTRPPSGPRTSSSATSALRRARPPLRRRHHLFGPVLDYVQSLSCNGTLGLDEGDRCQPEGDQELHITAGSLPVRPSGRRTRRSSCRSTHLGRGRGACRLR